MLTREENEMLTRVGPGTFMGELIRQYWIPFLLSAELPDPDGSTLRVRILGEDLIAFRDTRGRVGLLGNHCPHRGASLFYARNEEGGLRCIYHGWKFDVAGTCLDMPSEPPESNFKDKVRHKAYPCTERGGIVWTYMGLVYPLPPLPDLEWNLVPDEHRYLAKRVQNCNFAQALEGEIDQSHVSFLHASSTQLKPEVTPGSANVNFWRKKDTHPRFHVADTEYGVLIGAQRDVDEASCYWRITQFLLPFYTMTGPYGENPTRQSRMWVPMDDETTLLIAANFHPLRPLTEKEQERLRKGSGAGFVGVDNFRTPSTEPGGRWRPEASVENDFFFDTELQRTRLFSGIPEFWAQDAAVQESMGPIYDRSQEHLGRSDLAVIRVRQRLMEVAREFRDKGTPPPGVLDPEIYRVRGAAALLPPNANWLEATREIRKMIPGVNPSAPDH
jgi:phenylpropionate dioxygenase-like ring-hydroxylating dioxygenase large terminal subunit